MHYTRIVLAGENEPGASQGCSTLWDTQEPEQVVDACEGGTVAVLAERVGAVGLEDVEGETAQSGEYARVGADARAVLAEGHVAAVVGGGLNPPMPSNGHGSARRGERRVGNVEGGLRGGVQQAGLAVAGKYTALDTNDCGDVRTPVGAGELVGRIEDGDGAALVAVAAYVVTVIGFERRRGFGNCDDLLEQGRLVVLDLDDQRDIGFGCDLEVFF